MSVAPDVLIYIQAVKNFFDKNEEAKTYFVKYLDSQLFYKYLTEISQKNYEMDGEPVLHPAQMELLRKTLILHKISKENTDDTITKVASTFDTNGFGDVYLN